MNVYKNIPVLLSNLKPKTCSLCMYENRRTIHAVRDTVTAFVRPSKPATRSFWTLSFQRPCWHFCLGLYPSSSSSTLQQHRNVDFIKVSSAQHHLPTPPTHRSFPSLSLAAFAPGSLWPSAANEKEPRNHNGKKCPPLLLFFFSNNTLA